MEKNVEVGRISKITLNGDGISYSIEISFIFLNETCNRFKSVKTNICNFQVGDIVRLTKENAAAKYQIEKVLDLEEITYADFDAIAHMYYKLTEDELKKYHQFMIGKFCELDRNSQSEYSDLFLKKLSVLNYRRKTEQTNSFLNSKYVSQYYMNKLTKVLDKMYNEYIKHFNNLLEYMKNSDIPDYKKKYFEVKNIMQDREPQELSKHELEGIYDILIDEIKIIETSVLDKQLNKYGENSVCLSSYYFRDIIEYFEKYADSREVLNSEKDIHNFSGQEINKIYQALNKVFSSIVGHDDANLHRDFFRFLFNIESDGAREFLNQYADNKDVAYHILQSINLIVDYGYQGVLNENELKELFRKMIALDYDKALATYHFIERVDSFKIGAFSSKFLGLAKANYDFEKMNTNQSSNFFTKTMDNIGDIMSLGIGWVIDRKKQEALEKEKTELLRKKFLNLLSPILNGICFGEDYKKSQIEILIFK